MIFLTQTIERRTDMNEDHKKAISKANKGNSHSSKENREKNKMLKNIIKEVVMDKDGTKAKEIIQALVNKATDGDLRAIEILLDRIDGKVPQQNKIDGRLDGNHNHSFSVPMRIVTGIKNHDTGRDYIDLVPDGKGGSRPLQTSDYEKLEVTPEEAKKMDEEGWEGTTVEFVDPPDLDADGNFVRDDSEKC